MNYSYNLNQMTSPTLGYIEKNKHLTKNTLLKNIIKIN